MPGIDGAVVDDGFFLENGCCGRGLWLSPEEFWNPGIVTDEMDAGFHLRAFGRAAVGSVFTLGRIEQPEEPAAFAFAFAFASALALAFGLTFAVAGRFGPRLGRMGFNGAPPRCCAPRR